MDGQCSPSPLKHQIREYLRNFEFQKLGESAPAYSRTGCASVHPINNLQTYVGARARLVVSEITNSEFRSLKYNM